MINYITYSPDTATLLAEVEQVAPQYIVTDEDDSKSIGPLTKTPTVRNGDETLAIVKDLPGEMQSLDNLTIIGYQWWDESGDPQITLGTEAMSEADARAIYDRVYDQTPRTITDEDGNEYTHTPPPIFGAVR